METIDTLLNLFVFIFVGLMLWLYFKDTPGAPSEAFVRAQASKYPQATATHAQGKQRDKK